jgi:membrane-bound lytic murein transglycosylase B
MYHETHQAQKILTFQAYFQQLMPEWKIQRGRRYFVQYQSCLQQIEQQYGVPGQYLIALWGIESHFGHYTGHFPLINSLAVLGFQQHRSSYYRRQLIDALVMLDQSHTIPEQQWSSFDGGMGQAQFEPQTYLTFGVDFDHDGFKNIWTSVPDTLASMAFFLKENGWKRGQPWGIPVQLPPHFSVPAAGDIRHHFEPLEYWRVLGVKTLAGQRLPVVPGQAALLIPDPMSKEAYLVFENFKAFLRWNNTTFEGLVISLSGDKIAQHIPKAFGC